MSLLSFARDRAPVYNCYHTACPAVIKEASFARGDLILRCPHCRPEDLQPVKRGGPGDECPLHPGYPQAFHCPSCHRPLDLEAASSPASPFLGVPQTGKSLLMLVIAKLLDQPGMLSGLGLSATPLTDSRDYLHGVVNPLFSRGELPMKTRPGERANVAIKVRTSAARTKVFHFSDVDGGVWQSPATLAGAETTDQGQLRAKQRAAALRARTVVFLLDPERTRGLQDHTRINLLKDVDHLLAITGGLEGTEANVRSRFERLEAALRALGFPNRRLDEIELKATFAQVGLSRSLDEAHRLAGEMADRFESQSTGVADLGRYAQELEMYNREQRVAIVVSKGDALGAEFDSYSQDCRRIQIDEGVIDDKDRFVADIRSAGWRRAFERLSRRAEDLLPAPVVALAKEQRRVFKECAFFVVSTLGRPTEPVIASDGPGTVRAPVVINGRQLAAAPPASTCRLAGQRLVVGPTGRAPTPRNIWLPVLWSAMEP